MLHKVKKVGQNEGTNRLEIAGAVGTTELRK